MNNQYRISFVYQQVSIFFFVSAAYVEKRPESVGLCKITGSDELKMVLFLKPFSLFEFHNFSLFFQIPS